MADEPVPTTARGARDELVAVRASKMRDEAAARISRLLAALKRMPGAPPAVVDAVAALFAGYNDGEKLVSDNLWAKAVNKAWRWVEAEGEE